MMAKMRVLLALLLAAPLASGFTIPPPSSVWSKLYQRSRQSALEASTQQAVTFICRDGKEVTEAVDPAMLSDTLLELGALSVTCSDRAKGTDQETPVFRHHSHSPTWRSDGKGFDPALPRIDSLGVADETVPKLLVNKLSKITIIAYMRKQKEILGEPIVVDAVVTGMETVRVLAGDACYGNPSSELGRSRAR